MEVEEETEREREREKMGEEGKKTVIITPNLQQIQGGAGRKRRMGGEVDTPCREIGHVTIHRVRKTTLIGGTLLSTPTTVIIPTIPLYFMGEEGGGGKGYITYDP